MPSAPSTPTRRTANGQKTDGLQRLIPESTRVTALPRRRSSVAIVAALLCVGAGALLAVLAFKASSDRLSVLASTHAIAPGHVLSSSDLRVVDVSSDGSLSFLLAADEDSVVGRPAAVLIPAGVPLTGGDLGSPPQLNASEAVVGVLCKAGQYPPALATGDHVDVIDNGGSVATGAAGTTGSAANDTGLATSVDATVVGIDAPTDTATSGTIISLRLPIGVATDVARAAAAGRISLILIAPGS